MTLTCVIIDDEPLAVSLLEAYVDKTPFLQLKKTYNSAVQAVSDLMIHPVDLLFLDIQMPDLNGLEFSKMIDQAGTRIIFTTAFEQYALDSYKVNALDYLLKPISYADFLKSANKALSWYELVQSKQDISNPVLQSERKEPGTIFIKTEYKLLQIELNKILYIEGLKDYVKIYIENEPRPVLSLMSMKSMEELLPANRFIRVHRSFIVQVDKIKVIERNRIVFGKEYIPISDSYKERFFDFISNRSIISK